MTTRVPKPYAGVSHVLSRYQRALLYGAGIVISITLVLVTGFALYYLVNAYIKERQAEFVVRKSLLQVDFLSGEGALRADVLPAESAWGIRQTVSRYDEASLILDVNGKIVFNAEDISKGQGVTARALALQPWKWPNTGLDGRYSNGLFIIKDRVTSTDWILVYVFSWLTIMAELWRSLLGYIATMLLLLGFVWTVLLFLERKVFRPAYQRSQRVFESENRNRTIVEAADVENQAKSAFLATMSHEIRTPLNAILGNLELLGNSSLSRLQRERLQTVTTSSTQLLDIINDVLDFSKIESGQMIIEALPFSLIETTRQVGAIFAAVAQRKNVQFDIIIDDTLAAHYLGDAIRIRQIITNLVSNAIKFTESGEITLEVYRQDDNLDNSPIVIGVSDTGIGITPDQQRILFSSFMQADASTTKRYGGIGLGLALCKRLSDLMGGNIAVKSEINTGSTFIVTLPLPVVDSPIIAMDHLDTDIDVISNLSTEQNVPIIRILVVDDHPANLQLIQAQLEALGYQSDLADSGGMALKYFYKQSYDMIMTDLNMPDMDGYALARCLRAEGALLPILAITAYATNEEYQRCSNAGIDQLLIKPVLLKEMHEAICSLVKNKAGIQIDKVLPQLDFKGYLPASVHAALSNSLQLSLQALHKALKSGDMKTMLDHLHSVRGAFAMFHGADVVSACAQMEQQIRMGDMSGLRTALSHFESLTYAALAQRIAPDSSGSD